MGCCGGKGRGRSRARSRRIKRGAVALGKGAKTLKELIKEDEQKEKKTP